MEGFLRKLGIYGCDEIEDFILASLILGDPILLVGSHGTAKTMLCERLSKAMGLKFIAYDASKALFEDILGFPDPYSIKEGEINYVSTPISLHDKEFVLIDEISRANYQMQNKWLEVIRSRKIMGKPLSSLRYVFGAMNPPYYPGAKTLDPALSGRFCFIIWFPHFADLNEDDKKLVISNVSEDDAPLIQRKKEETIDYEKIGEELSDFLNDVRNSIYPSMDKRLRESVNKFLNTFVTIQKEEEAEWVIDGRRAGMMKRGIVSVLSVMEKKGNFSEKNFSEYLLSIVPFLLPYSVEREDYNKEDFETFLVKVVGDCSGESKQQKSVIETMTMLTKIQSAAEKEANIERKFILLERISPILMKEISNRAVKRRVFEFFEEVFSPTAIKDILKIEKLHKNQITISSIDANCMRLTRYMLPEEDRKYGETLFTTFNSLKEIVTKRYSRKKR